MSANTNAAAPERIAFHVVHDCTLEDGKRLLGVRLAGPFEQEKGARRVLKLLARSNAYVVEVRTFLHGEEPHV